MAVALVKFGLAALGLGLLSFLVLMVAMGGIGPCVGSGQVAALILGLAGTGIGGLVLLVSLPAVLVRRHKARDDVGSFFPVADKKSDRF
jgi:hypothetical protein